jgi:hypothetical protein
MRRIFLKGIFAAAMASLLQGEAMALSPFPLTFAGNPAGNPHAGKAAQPQFEGRDRAFRAYRTRLREALVRGPNFAGHLSVAQIGCGAGCLAVYAIDRRTGRVIRFPFGGEEHVGVELTIRTDSRLALVHWNDTETVSSAHVLWTGRAFQVLDRRERGPVDRMDDIVKEDVAAGSRP